MCSFQQLWLAYVSELLPPQCDFISIRLLAGVFSVRSAGCWRAGSGQDQGKLEFASQISLVLMGRAELQRSKQRVWSVHGFYYWIQCVQLKLLIILTGGNHKMKADRMWSHQKALELSLSVVVLCFLSTQNLFGGKDIGSSMSNFVHLHLNAFLQCRVLNMVFPALTGVCRAHADRWWPSGRPAECAWHQLCCGKPDIGMHHCIQLCTHFLKLFTIRSH